MFDNNQWQYLPYECNEFWSYSYVVNVTAAPIALDLAYQFQVSNVTLSNSGWCAGFDYAVTVANIILNDQWTSCTGTIEPNDPPVTCQVFTVPRQFLYSSTYYLATITITNRDWVCDAAGNIAITQVCNDGSPAGADLCTGGQTYGYYATQSSPALLGYVTGGCVSSLAPNANCGAASFCCPDGTFPSSTTSCGNGDGSFNSPCFNCTGFCA